MDKLHDTITSKGVMESTPNNLIPKGVPDPRYIKGKQFSDAITYLRDTGPLKDAGLSKQHVQDLEDIGRLLHKGGEIQNSDPVSQVLKVLKLTGGISSAGTGYGVSALLGKVLTDADAAATIAKALKPRAIPASLVNVYREGSGSAQRVSDHVDGNIPYAISTGKVAQGRGEAL